MIFHQFENLRPGRTLSASHTFLVTVYRVETEITANQVRPYTDTDSPVYLLYTASDPVIPSNNPDIILKAAEILGNEKNPYRKAKLIYDWVTETMEWKEHENPNRGVLDALADTSGSAWDMALLFTTLARASGIPAIPVAGIVVDENRESRIHWWAEFYLENFGWVPVDPAMGLSKPVHNPATIRANGISAISTYRIAFSRGWTDKTDDAKAGLYIARARSVSAHLEESGGNLEKYTSFWEIRVTGVY